MILGWGSWSIIADPAYLNILPTLATGSALVGDWPVLGE